MTYTAFISISLKHRHKMTSTINAIVKTLAHHNVAANIFVDNYTFNMDEADEMMRQSCNDISESDFVIAEVSHKAIGVGVEVGFAMGVGKPVIYMRHEDAEHSTTITGISTHKIIYSSNNDIQEQLTNLLNDLLI